MRDYWQEHRVAPDVRHVVDYLVNTQGYDKKTAKKHLFDLFPYGYVKQACKVAGMQRPRAWSTG
jgi:TusE/DsrC/DsvC family sulfur relay protein